MLAVLTSLVTDSSLRDNYAPPLQQVCYGQNDRKSKMTARTLKKKKKAKCRENWWKLRQLVVISSSMASVGDDQIKLVFSST